ncbi:MAG: DinB family protein [Actinomycetota bacterium]|nr:DinB family protein [Actinomycetota bacterium]
MSAAATRELDWNELLVEQLVFHWEHHLRPRLDGLGDDEYRWEPVPGCWGIRPRAEATTAMAAGAGDLVIDFELPEPDPVPVTTIAWRIGHLLVGVFGERNANHFAGPPVSYADIVWPSTAGAALDELDAAYERWLVGIRGLGEDRLADPVGPAEGPFAELPYAALVLHIHREVIHHGAEVLLLRDLYRSAGGGPLGPTT